jgi:hypothetical protein
MVRVEQQEQELKKGRGPRVEVIDKQRRYTVENPRERERENSCQGRREKATRM